MQTVETNVKIYVKLNQNTWNISSNTENNQHNTYLPLTQLKGSVVNTAGLLWYGNIGCLRPGEWPLLPAAGGLCLGLSSLLVVPLLRENGHG